MQKPEMSLALETALLIIPPPEVQLFAGPIMQQYAPDRSALGPAHITLFYPFFNFADREEAVPTLAEVCRCCPPVPVTLDHYERFPSVCYFAPADSGPIQELFNRIQASFPEIQPFEGKFGPDLVPHLTLAECGNMDGITLPPPPTFEFVIDRLHLYAGYPAPSAWVPYDTFHLQG